MSLRGSKNCSYDVKFVDCKITQDQQHSTFDERICYVHSPPMSYDNTSFLYFSVSGTALFAGICDHWKMKFIHWAFKNATLVISFRVQQTFRMVFFSICRVKPMVCEVSYFNSSLHKKKHPCTRTFDINSETNEHHFVDE